MKLYGPPYSRAFRVQWMLAELDLPHEQIPVDFFSGQTHTKEFLAINPNGRVPAWSDQNGTFWESLSINLYLAKLHSANSLGPKNVVEDAHITQWSFWVLTELETPLLVLLANTHMFLPEYRDAEEKALALDKLSRPLSVLNATLEDGTFLVGDRFTVADLNVASVLTMGILAEMNLESYPNVKKWLQKCIARPAAIGYEAMRLPPGPRPPHWKQIVM